MQPPETIEQFLELGQKSGLLDKQGLDAYLDQMRATSTLPDAPKMLATLMVRDGLLTQFQAKQLLLGKWRGFTIAGKYKLLGYLGAGGMARVFLCEHTIMRRRVAVKVLPSSQVDDPGCLERFHREARAAAALDHPNIVRAYDIDREGKLHFLVMEYIEGTGLDQIVKKEGPLDCIRAARYIAGAASGLQHAHEAGLVHRDIKPANLLVDRGNIVKILDMGLARFFHDNNDELTKEHDSEKVLGTADFLAPEQAVNSHDVDIRADIYSLGVTFYFLITGKRPFGDEPVVKKLLGHLMLEPRPIRDIRPEVPEELAAVISKMMAKDRDVRYQTPAEVVADLAPWAELNAPTTQEEKPTLSSAASSSDTMKAKMAPATATARVTLPITAVQTPPPKLTSTSTRKGTSSGKHSQGVKVAHRSSRAHTVVRSSTKGRDDVAPVDYRLRWIIVAAGAAAAFLLFGVVAITVFVVTDRGTLVIEIMDPDIQVTVKGEGQEIVITDTQTKQKIVLKSGEYQVQPGKGGSEVKLSQDKFKLSRGEQVTVRAWLEKPKDNDRQPAQPTQSINVATAPRTLHLLQGHTDRIEGVAFSPDGKRALSTGHDKTVRLWEIPSGRLLRTLNGHEGPGWCVAFLPDGRRAVSCSSDRTIRLWNLDTGVELRRLEGHTDEIKAMALSLDGRRLFSGSQDNTLRLWDMETGKELRRLEGHTAGVWGVAISPDGRRGLSGASDKTLRLWDLDEGKELRTYEGHTDEVRRVAFSADGHKALSCGFDMTMRLWDVESGKELRRFDGQPYYVESVAFSPDSRFALTSEGTVPSNDPALSSDRGIRLWDLESGKLVYRRGGVPDKVLHTVFSPDGSFALSACDDKNVRLWYLPQDKLGVFRRLEGHTDRIEGVAFSPDGKRALSTGHDKTVRLWEIPSGRPLRTLTGHEGPGWCVAFLPDGRRAVSCSSDRTIRLWNVDTGVELRRLEGHTDEIKAMALSSDGRRLFSGSQDNTLRLWDVETGKELRRLEGHTAGIWGVAISPDGRRGLSGGSDKSMRLWDLDVGKELRAYEGHTADVRRVAFSTDGHKALSCSFDMTMRLWDVESGKELRRFDGRPFYVESVAFSPDSRYGLTSEGMVPSNDPALSSDRGIRLWDLESGKQVYRRGGVPDKVLHTVFSPDGRYALSACDDKGVRLWNLPPLSGIGNH